MFCNFASEQRAWSFCVCWCCSHHCNALFLQNTAIWPFLHAKFEDCSFVEKSGSCKLLNRKLKKFPKLAVFLQQAAHTEVSWHAHCTTCTVSKWYDRTKYFGMLDCKIQRKLMSAWTQAQTFCESGSSNIFFCLLLGHLYAAWSAWDFKVELSCTNYSSDKQLELFNVKPHNS